jgi:hypothetical protein
LDFSGSSLTLGGWSTMNRSFTQSSLKQIDLHADDTLHSWFQWLYLKRKIIFWTLSSVILVILLIYGLIAKQTVNAESDFFQIQTAFLKLQQEHDFRETQPDLKTLNTMMERYPELKPKYEGALAQKLLMIGEDLPLVTLFAEDMFQRTQSEPLLRYYQDYSRTSLWMSEGHYAEALQDAQSLQQSLSQANLPSTSLLSVFNLLRLALLHQKLGQPQEELQIWEQLQSHPQYLEAFVAVNQAFKVGETSLNQYIEERKKVLMPYKI